MLRFIQHKDENFFIKNTKQQKQQLQQQKYIKLYNCNKKIM